VDTTRILGIAGSLRQKSYNRAALRAAQTLLPDGALLDIFTIDGIPIFNEDDEADPPAAVGEFKRRILAADAILFVTPEYNHSLPGGLKNAIDWAARPPGDSAWPGKPAAIMGASPDRLGSARAQHHLRQILLSLDMPLVAGPEVMIAAAPACFDAAGRLTDDKTAQLIKQLLSALVSQVRRSRAPTARPDAGFSLTP
jgi:chromate reductase, NAD(P)H dehydrogenase (quinone)